jgi:hypothetical protein
LVGSLLLGGGGGGDFLIGWAVVIISIWILLRGRVSYLNYTGSASLGGRGNMVATERRGTCVPPLTAGLVNLLCGAANFGIVWSACEQHEIKYA